MTRRKLKRLSAVITSRRSGEVIDSVPVPPGVTPENWLRRVRSEHDREWFDVVLTEQDCSRGAK